MMRTAQCTLLHLLILSVSAISCGFLAIGLGKELGWDLANYHFYGPYAYWTKRYAVDYWPTSYIQQFLNPTLDLLSYFLIEHLKPKQVEFALGFLHGINIYLLFIIARLFLPNKVLLPLGFALLGMYGPTTLPGIGSFQQDNLISLFVLSFVFLQLWLLQQPHLSPRKAGGIYFIAFLMLGLGTGLKLTCGLYFVGAFVAACIVIRPYRILIPRMIVSLMGFALGLIITSGHWMLFMWQQYNNPVFPFLNNIFKSPYFLLQNWQDVRFMPKTIGQHLFYPFFFSWDGRIADLPFQDVRFLIIYLLLIGLFVIKLGQRFKIATRVQNPTLTLSQRWFISFFVTSYIMWQWYFSIARYLMALEMLAPLFIYLLIRVLFVKKYMARIALALCCYALLCLLIPPPMIRTHQYHDSFFNVSLPSVVQETQQGTILTAFPAYTMDMNPRPQSYLVPFFPQGYRFIGIPFLHGKYHRESLSHAMIVKKLAAASAPIYLLTVTNSLPELYRAAQHFKLQPTGPCQQVSSDRQALTDQLVWLCPVA